MTLLVAFAATLFVASLLSGVARRTIISLAALLLLGALMSLEVVGRQFALAEYLFIALTLLAVWPFALLIAFYRSGLARHEWLAVAWFGPKGFASMVYGLFILESGLEQGSYLFHLIALIVSLSIIAHSSTDVVARWLDREDGAHGTRHVVAKASDD